MAIGLVGIAKHTVDSVFSYSAADLNKIVFEGDRLYTSLRKGKKSGCSEILCVPELPKRLVTGCVVPRKTCRWR